MKKTILLTSILFAATTAIIISCKKTSNTTNNIIINHMPAFTVNGIHDITLVNAGANYITLPITVQYSDSAQEVVTLSLSALPSNVNMDTTWITSGIPTFSTNINIADTTLDGATPGNYPMILTATGATSGKKTYPFNLKIVAETPCIAHIVGKYSDCYYSCSTGGYYADSVYSDPVTVNKIWFSNINNTGIKIYARYNCGTQQLTIPAQTVGGVTYSGSGSAYYSLTSHHISVNLNTGTTFCSLSMN